MEEQLISFKTSKLAKEKGFDVTVPQGYNSEELEYQKFGLPKGVQFGICTNHLPNSYTAPTQSLLQRWLREKHNLHVIVNCYDDKGNWSLSNIRTTNLNSMENLYKTHDLRKKHEKISFSIYEEAMEIGLQEALKMI